MSYVLLILGCAMLYFGAEWLVTGASRLALAFRVPELIVGLTVVAYGTSMPEVIVGVEAATDGHGGIALGNVIGSNVANLGLVLGGAVVVRPARADGALFRREVPVLIAATGALLVVLRDGVVSPPEATVLLVAALAYTLWMVRAASVPLLLREAESSAEATAEASDLAGGPRSKGRNRDALVAVVGLVTLLLGGKSFVGAAAELARDWGMSERLVGLTVVAVGTSLPELATTLVAAARGHSDIAIGNVVGSNIFNVLLCLGAAGLLGSVVVRPADYFVDLFFLCAMTLVGVAFLRGDRVIRRAEGALLLAAYSAFVVLAAR
jgi:cation:H+ antiporter